MSTRLQTPCVLYWLHDASSVCLMRHGYVGISTRWQNRLRRHRRDKKLPPFDWKILFEGTLLECLTFERRLRPLPGIGWNDAPGGEHGGGSAPKAERTKLLMRDAALRRYAQPGERERTQTAVKTAFKQIDRTGVNNGHFGKHHTEETKSKLRANIIERGGVAGVKNPMFGKRRTDLTRDKSGRFASPV